MGNKAAALARIREATSIGNLLENEPILVIQLARLAMLGQALESLRFVSSQHELSSNEMDSLLRLASPCTDLKPVLLGTPGERILLGKWAFEPNQAKLEELKSWAGEPSFLKRSILRFYYTYSLRPILNIDHAAYLNVMRVNAELLEKDIKTVPTADAHDLVKKEIEGARGGIMGHMMAPDLTSIRMRMASCKAMFDLTGITIACNNYRHKNGTYPNSLRDIAHTPLDELTGNGPRLHRQAADIEQIAG